MHRTLKQETASPPEINLSRQQRSFDRFRRCYNDERPHEALGQVTPASVYAPSLRAFPEKLPELEYPRDWELRRVQRNGTIRWRSDFVLLTPCLESETVALQEVDLHRWNVHFGSVFLGVLDDRSSPPRLISAANKAGKEPVTHVLGLNRHPCPRLHR